MESIYFRDKVNDNLGRQDKVTPKDQIQKTKDKQSSVRQFLRH